MTLNTSAIAAVAVGVGTMMVVIGLATAGYFFFIYDTTVGGVHNFGLMQNRSLGCGAALVIATHDQRVKVRFARTLVIGAQP